MRLTHLRMLLIAPLAALIMTSGTPVSANDWRGKRIDRFEDRIDRREDRIDRRVNRGPIDRIEDRLDRIENRFDRRTGPYRPAYRKGWRKKRYVRRHFRPFRRGVRHRHRWWYRH